MRSGEKRVRMQLYKMHDFDLVKYYISLRNHKLNNKRMAFPTIMKELLRGYVRGNKNFFPPNINQFSMAKLPSVIRVRFVLNEETDEDVIHLLQQIEKGQINSFLKSLLRRNLSVCDLRCYLKEDSLQNISELPKEDSQVIPEHVILKPDIQKIGVVKNHEIKQHKEKEMPEFCSSTAPKGFNFFDAISGMVEN